MCDRTTISINISVEILILHTLTEDKKMKSLSIKMLGMLERLAEMFPKQSYQSDLDRYISSRHPQNAVDVEHFTKEFEQKTTQGKIL
jgi:hypothetical protein